MVRRVHGPHQVNMADVARRAGVSTSTVSRALRGMPGVSENQRRRIQSIADELSYVISPEASRLSRGATGRVAVVVPTIDRWYFSTMLAGIESTLRDADLDVLIYHVGGAADRQRFFHELPVRRKADAAIVISLPVPDEEAARLDLLGVQVVVAGGQIRDYPHVRIDDHKAAEQAVGHLAGLGHRRIGMIRTHDGEGRLWPADMARTQGYLQSLRAAGLEHDTALLVTVPFGIHGGMEAVGRLLALPEPPTAVFCHSDEVAFGAMRALRLASVTVPVQCSVVGVDDHPMSEILDLTTVRQPVERQGRIAGEMILELLGSGMLREPVRVVSTELVVRDSTAPVSRETATAGRGAHRGAARSPNP
jgi:LacI family repressor for deo operon, udp, cdd, tsx, nupC, and nupG